MGKKCLYVLLLLLLDNLTFWFYKIKIKSYSLYLGHCLLPYWKQNLHNASKAYILEPVPYLTGSKMRSRMFSPLKPLFYAMFYGHYILPLWLTKFACTFLKNVQLSLFLLVEDRKFWIATGYAVIFENPPMDSFEVSRGFFLSWLLCLMIHI